MIGCSLTPEPGLTRAEFLKLMGAAGVLLAAGGGESAAAPAGAMLTRAIPKSGEALPVVGLGTGRPSTSATMRPRWRSAVRF